VSKGGLLATCLFLATAILIVVGTVHPIPSALAYARNDARELAPSSTPEAALNNLGAEIRAQAWNRAYASLANKAQFTKEEFVRDLTGSYPCLRSSATLNAFEVYPLHAGTDEAEARMRFHWSTSVGVLTASRDFHLVRDGSLWKVEWPIRREPTAPPQVIPVNYLHWDVIYRGPGDDWGAQDAESPHVRIIDMHPVERADGVFIMGELLNEDVVPAYVSVSATLLNKNQAPIATEGSFDKISHLLLPKQVTPFLILFPNLSLSKIGSIQMTPFSTLIPASADPVIELEDEKLNPMPDPSLTGQLVNQSGQIVNVAHVLGTFYDRSGQVVWVADQYIDRALVPQSPVPFDIHIPQDLAGKVSSQRTVVSTYSFRGTA
jgi:hypothetical protein